MLTLSGSPALSDFRIQKLEQRIKEAGITFRRIYAEFVHFVETTSPLSDEEHSVLHKLLSYGPSQARSSHEGEKITVVPRFGTISPWSSKATDIANNAGLTAVKRIERGVVYYIEGCDDIAAIAAIAALAAMKTRNRQRFR